MDKKLFFAPLILSSSGGAGSVIGQGSGQGSHVPAETPYSVWLDEIAFGYIGPTDEAPNPDADFNGDGQISQQDYIDYCAANGWDPIID